MFNYIVVQKLIYRIYFKVRLTIQTVQNLRFNLIIKPKRKFSTRLLLSIELNLELPKCNPKIIYRNPHSVN
jgi:hypothetical protein